MKQSYADFESLLQDFSERVYKAVVLVGLPGSGKSTLAEKLASKFEMAHLSSDKARVEILKINRAKFSRGAKEYLAYKDKVYEFIRKWGSELLESGKRVIFDATHINEQRAILLQHLQNKGWREVVVIYVDGGDKDKVRERIKRKSGKNEDGRTWEEAWETAYNYFADQIERGIIKIPSGEENGYKVVMVRNYL